MFIPMYLEILSSHPLATLVASVFVLAIALHIIIPIVLQVKVFLLNYWSCGKANATNKYLKLFYRINYRVVKLDKGYAVKNRDGRYYDKDDEKFWTDIFNSSYFESVQDAHDHMKLYGTTKGYDVVLFLLILIGMVSTIISTGIEYVLLNYFTLSLIVALIVCFVIAILKGGRWIYALNEKVESVKSNAPKEASVDDSPSV